MVVILSDTEEKPLLLWEVIKILEKRRGSSQHWDKADQRKVYEYASKFYKLELEDALELLNILVEKFNIPRVIAVQLVDTLPVTLDELEPFFKELEDIVQHAKVYKAGELPQFIKEVIDFSEKFNGMTKDQRENFVRDLLDALRMYWEKSRKIVEVEKEE